MGLPAYGWAGALAAGTGAFGAEVEGFFTDLAYILDPTYDGIDNTNIKNGANIDGLKLADATVTGAKLVAATVEGAKIAPATILDSNILWAATTGLKALHLAGAQRKAFWGRVTINAANWNGGAAGPASSHTVTFSTGAEVFDSNFASTTGLEVFLTIKNTIVPATEWVHVKLDTTSTSNFLMTLWDGKGPLGAGFAPAGTITVSWMAVGRSA